MPRNLGGIRYTDAQLRAVRELGVLGHSTLVGFRARTTKRLVSCGLVESFVPEAASFAQASRGRVRHYRLTKAGREAYLLIREEGGSS